jgi:SAM-dependent methyltransferase
MQIITRTTCRLCGSSGLREVFSLGEQYINDFVPYEKVGTGLKAPLDLVLCDRCSLLQLRHTAPQDILYARHYWYRSGVTATMRRALRDIAEQVEAMLPLQRGDVVLDIGANDGTLLASYSVPGIRRVGCEPANNLVDLLRENADYVMHDFWDYERYTQLADQWGLPHPTGPRKGGGPALPGSRGKGGKAKVITAIGMFYDLEDPNQFIRDARQALAEDGIFVAQLMCLAPMLEKNDVGNICHEHLEYYSLESLEYLFNTNGLEIFKVEENDVNGGSYRIYARHDRGTGISFDEKFTFDDFMAFARRVQDNRDRCVEFIKQQVARGKTVYVYGASTKGNVILQYYALDHTLITAASEKSPEKWGKYTIGTWIPIVSEAEARRARPDYFLVLPWAFFEEFYEREREWRAGGGQFIVPLPEFRVVP